MHVVDDEENPSAKVHRLGGVGSVVFSESVLDMSSGGGMVNFFWGKNVSSRFLALPLPAALNYVRLQFHTSINKNSLIEREISYA